MTHSALSFERGSWCQSLSFPLSPHYVKATLNITCMLKTFSYSSLPTPTSSKPLNHPIHRITQSQKFPLGLPLSKTVMESE